MNLHDAIAEITNWEQHSAEQLLAILTSLSIEYVDTRNYTWGGVADVLGNDTTEALRQALENGSLWAVFALGGLPGLQLCRPDIQEKLYQLENSGIVPGAAILARHVRRMVSPLEHNKIVAGLAEVEKALSEMLLIAKKQKKEDNWNDRLQLAREKLAVWNGDPGTEPDL